VPSFACIFAETLEGRIIVYRQYLHEPRRVGLLFPGGHLEPNESPKDADGDESANANMVTAGSALRTGHPGSGRWETGSGLLHYCPYRQPSDPRIRGSRRAIAALAVGADMAFVEAPQNMAEVAGVPRLVKGPCLLKRGAGQRMVDGKNFPLADEVRYILGRAAEHDGRIIAIGQIILFSTETDDPLPLNHLINCKRREASTVIVLADSSEWGG
jgi:hypothetical protein